MFPKCGVLFSSFVCFLGGAGVSLQGLKQIRVYIGVLLLWGTKRYGCIRIMENQMEKNMENQTESRVT